MAGSLAVVGTGIRAIGQTSPEALARITQADKVFFMLGDPLARVWLTRLNPSAESLLHYYAPGKERIQTYRAVVARVLATLGDGVSVCMVTTGHPGVFSYAAQEMVRQARAAGYQARMLPGVSAEDCLFADLGVDPGGGLASYEATHFLTGHPPIDECTALVLWQIGSIGEPGFQPYAESWNPAGVVVLGEVLAQTYGADHEAVVYEAARYAFVEPSIQRVALGRIGDARVTVLSTLYVPPRAARPIDPEMVRRLSQCFPDRLVKVER